MDSLRQIIKNNHMLLRLSFYDDEECAKLWEVKSIIDNPEIFGNFYSKYPLVEIKNIDDFVLYMLSKKIATMKSIVADIDEEHREKIIELSSESEKILGAINIGEVIKFINKNIEQIFYDDFISFDLRNVTLAFIAKYNSGINIDSFSFICDNFQQLMINRFDDFEKTFEKNPDLFELLYNKIENYNYTDLFFCSIKKTLDIWKHIELKTKSNLKAVVEGKILILNNRIIEFIDNANIDNSISINNISRKFLSFLKDIKSPLTYKFKPSFEKIEELTTEKVKRDGLFYKQNIDIENAVENWKKVDVWESKLLSLTHSMQTVEDHIVVKSHLDIEPKLKSIVDFADSNIKTDGFFTFSHQEELNNIILVYTKFLELILCDSEARQDYFEMVYGVLKYIVETLVIKDESLLDDVEIMFQSVDLVINNTRSIENVKHSICYGTAMFICAFTEKVIRTVYIDILKDERYVPVETTTLGAILSVFNKEFVEIFGENHIKNLMYFLSTVEPNKIGNNLRNSLAHLGNINASQFQPDLVIKLLYLFTDILNTIFWYFISRPLNGDEYNDKL